MTNIEKFISVSLGTICYNDKNLKQEKYVLFGLRSGEYTNGVWLFKPTEFTHKLFLELNKYFKNDGKHISGFDPSYLYKSFQDDFVYCFELKILLQEYKINKDQTAMVFKFKDNHKIGIDKRYLQILQKYIPNLKLKAISGESPIFILSNDTLVGFIMPINGEYLEKEIKNVISNL